MFCRIFDRLNSRSPFAPGQKRAITRTNVEEVASVFADAEHYLVQLKDAEGKLIIKSRMKTFIIGLISSMKSTISLAKVLFAENVVRLYYIIPWRLCQDPIEHFFGDLRARGSWCLNPTALYFSYSYKALVSNKLRLTGLS
jgi:hypothetical protein